MTPQELIARARSLSEAATPGPWQIHGKSANKWDNIGRCGDGCGILVYGPHDSDFIAASRTLIPALADALEEALRDREPWRTKSADELHLVVNLRKERDTARAQVETLAEALRWYENLARNNSFPSADSIEIWNDRGGRARAALKAAGVEE